MLCQNWLHFCKIEIKMTAITMNTRTVHKLIFHDFLITNLNFLAIWVSGCAQLYVNKQIRVIWSIVHACSVMSNSLHPLDCSPPDSSVHRISQARIVEWVSISHFLLQGISQTGDQIRVSWTADRFFTHWAILKTLNYKEIQPVNPKGRILNGSWLLLSVNG